MLKKNNSELKTEESGILSSIWILACNDENPIITYRSIRDRLGLTDSYDLEGLIKRHRELFRLKIPEFRLQEFKEQLIANKKTPSWLKEVGSEEERIKIINSLTVDDFFRSQFRTKANSETSSIEIIDWGLEHIERIRKSKAEIREEELKRRTGLWLPLGSLLIALITVVLSGYWQYENIQAQQQMKDKELDFQMQIKQYEMSFKPKHDGYVAFTQSMYDAFKEAMKTSPDPNTIFNKDEGFMDKLNKMAIDYLAVESFLDDKHKKEIREILNNYLKFLNAVAKENKNELSKGQKYKEYSGYANLFVKKLREGLFNEAVGTEALFNETINNETINK